MTELTEAFGNLLDGMSDLAYKGGCKDTMRQVLNIIDQEIAKAETNRDSAGNMARENYYDTMIDGMEVVKNAIKELEDKTE